MKLIGTLLISAALFGQAIPRPSPDFSVMMLTGKKLSVADYKGKILLVAGLLTT
jgi:hypothetical protein